MADLQSRRLTRDQVAAAVGTNPRAIRLIEALGDDILTLSQLIEALQAIIDALGTPGDFSTNTATSIVDELVLFADTTGKLGKRATGNGYAKLAAGVLGLLTVAQTRADLGEKVVTLTDAATIDINAALGNNFRVVLGGNRTLANPTGLIDGQVFNVRILQDGTGGRTLAYGSMYAFPGGTAPVLSTAADALDFMSCQYDAADGTLICVMNKAFEVPAP
jgi:hypothetical protein